MVLAHDGRASSEPLPDSTSGFGGRRRRSGSEGRSLNEVGSSGAFIMEPRVVTVTDPEQTLYPVNLRNTGGQHILFKVKIRRRQVEDWIVYPVMGVISPRSTQTVYLTRNTTVQSLHLSQSGPMLVETSVVDEANARRTAQSLWDSILGEGRVNVQSRILPIEIRLENDPNGSAPTSPITPTHSRPNNSSIIPWLSSVELPLVPPDIPIPQSVTVNLVPSTPLSTESQSAPLSPTDWYIPPPPPYEKIVGYSSGPRDLKAASAQRKMALRVVE